MLHQAVSGGVADDLTQMMVGVVENGTGSNVQIPGVSVAGKTGTANSAQDQVAVRMDGDLRTGRRPEVAVAVLRRVDRGRAWRDQRQRPGRADRKPIMEAVINE